LYRAAVFGYLLPVSDRLRELQEATAQAVLRGPGTTSAELRQALARGEPPEELATLVDKIRRHAYRVTDEDLAALRDRYTEDQLFEVVVAAALGAAEARLRAGMRALEEA
jgi:alkylhydroperoxidase family enzyme